MKKGGDSSCSQWLAGADHLPITIQAPHLMSARRLPQSEFDPQSSSIHFPCSITTSPPQSQTDSEPIRGPECRVSSLRFADRLVARLEACISQTQR